MVFRRPPLQPNASSRALPAGPAVASGGETPVTVLYTLQYVSYVPREPAGPCVVGEAAQNALVLARCSGQFLFEVGPILAGAYVQ